MSVVRITRANQRFALAYEAAFANPQAPTVAELTNDAMVFDISCALTEDGTELTLADSETDDTLTFCSIGSESTATSFNSTASLTWLLDANTGGSGSTADLASLFNLATALLGRPGMNYWIISQTGPQGVQNRDFEAGDIIKLALFETDYMVQVLENGSPVRGQQTPLFRGQVAWNVEVQA